MYPRNLIVAALLAFGGVFSMAACSAGNDAGSAPSGTSQVPAPAASPRVSPHERRDAGISESHRLLVHKHPSCGCCVLWIEHMREAGFAVDVRDHEDMGPVKQRVGVPYAKGSCHTAEVDGYFIEGHVPAEDVKRLLAERPDARGLTVPGMPAGSPGMELPDGRTQPYSVELVHQDGRTSEYARHGE